MSSTLDKVATGHRLAHAGALASLGAVAALALAGQFVLPNVPVDVGRVIVLAADGLILLGAGVGLAGRAACLGAAAEVPAGRTMLVGSTVAQALGLVAVLMAVIPAAGGGWYTYPVGVLLLVIAAFLFLGFTRAAAAHVRQAWLEAEVRGVGRVWLVAAAAQGLRLAGVAGVLDVVPPLLLVLVLAGAVGVALSRQGAVFHRVRDGAREYAAVGAGFSRVPTAPADASVPASGPAVGAKPWLKGP